jgi:hypothetical protein
MSLSSAVTTLGAVAGSAPKHDLVRRRRFARASSLKRRSAIASTLGFAALFGLAAQHTVKGAPTRGASPAPSRAARAVPTTFFDERTDGFSFGDAGSASAGSSTEAPPPITQTSVS